MHVCVLVYACISWNDTPRHGNQCQVPETQSLGAAIGGTVYVYHAASCVYHLSDCRHLAALCERLVIVSVCRAASCVHHQSDRRLPSPAALYERFVIVCVRRAASCMYHRLGCRHLAALYERFVIVCVCRAAPCTHHRSDCWRSVLGNLCERFAIVFVLRSVACVHQWSDCWHLDSSLLKLSAVRPPTSGHPSQEGVLFDLLLTYISAKNKIKRNLPFPDLRSLRDHSAGVHSHN